MTNQTPYEVLAGSPVAVFYAPVGTAFPSLDTADASFNVAWQKLGVSGDLSYDRGAGITIEHPQTVTPWRPLGSPGPVKAFRQDEDLNIKLKVVDLTLEAYAVALGGNTVTPVAAGVGTAGYKWLGLSRGQTVQQWALLVRLLASPYGSAWIGQYQIPKASEVGSPVVQYMRDTPAGLELNFMAMLDLTASTEAERFGKLLFQTDEADT